MTRWREMPSGLLVPEELAVDEEAQQPGEPGCCAGCGCTETTPCVIEGDDPDGIDDTHCAWTDATRTLCTGCI